MTTCLGKSCSLGLPWVPFVNCCHFMYLVVSLLVLRVGCGIWLYQLLIIAYLFTLQKMTIMMRPSCWHQNFGPKGLSAPAQGLCLNFFSSITADIKYPQHSGEQYRTNGPLVSAYGTILTLILLQCIIILVTQSHFSSSISRLLLGHSLCQMALFWLWFFFNVLLF